MSEPTAEKLPGHFIRNIIENDLAQGATLGRRWSGKPGYAAHKSAGEADRAKIRTRFPPEPNGYLHLGHAKSICLNFGLAQDYDGICHLRFDDTNPEKEEQEYVDAIIESVRWLGFDWCKPTVDGGAEHLYFASNYFEWMFEAAQCLIRNGDAYVDSQSAQDVRAGRGTLTTAGRNSPYRDRSIEDNLDLFNRMRAGEFPDGAHILRAKIDMASGNINMRDPTLYRIRRAIHHNTGDAWCIYPMYTFAHPIEDALENITHSICTLEFEDQRPFYDWLLDKLACAGLFARPLPRQIEFARLNLSYTVLSKRKLIQLVEDKHVRGWDDPRLPTLAGVRRRGFTPEGLRLFAEMIGVSKSDALIDLSILEECQRTVLNATAPRRIVVIDPIRLVIDNYPTDGEHTCLAPHHPQHPDWGQREIPFSRTLLIERDDFCETPPKGYFRLYPGNRVRLRYGFVVECTGCEKDASGQVTVVYARYFPDSQSGTEGANRYKVKGNIHWLSERHACAAELRLIDRLFKTASAGQDLDNFLDDINPDALRTVTAMIEPALANAAPEAHFQFERHGYFVVDRKDSAPGAPVFNRTVTLKDSWSCGIAQK
jgi:glutaminyl-tRNA synthetase